MDLQNGNLIWILTRLKDTDEAMPVFSYNWENQGSSAVTNEAHYFAVLYGRNSAFI